MDNKLLAQLCEDIGRARSGVDYLVEQAKRTDAVINEHSRRIRKLEWLAAKLSAIFGIFATVGAGIVSFCKRNTNG